MSELVELRKALLVLGRTSIRKSAREPLSRVEEAIAITKATETPAGSRIAKRIIQLERQAAVRKQFGMPNEDDLYEKIKENEREHAQLVQQLRVARGGKGRASDDDDEWSAQFSEA